MRSGVSLLSRKAWAIRPANPTRITSGLRDRLRRPRARRDRAATRSPASTPARISVDAPARRSDRDPAQPGRALGHHEDAGQAAALERARRWDARRRGGPRRRGHEQPREEARAQARRRGQVRSDLEAVGGRVPGGGDRPDGRRRAARPGRRPAPPGRGPGAAGRRGLPRRWPGPRGRRSPSISMSGVPGVTTSPTFAGREADRPSKGARSTAYARLSRAAATAARGRGGARAALVRLLGRGRALLRAGPRRAPRSTSAAFAAASAATRPDRRATSSSRATTAPAATRSPSRHGSSTTDAGIRAASAARCRACTVAGTAMLPAPPARSTTAVRIDRGGVCPSLVAGFADSRPQAASPKASAARVAAPGRLLALRRIGDRSITVLPPRAGARRRRSRPPRRREALPARRPGWRLRSRARR